MKRRRVMERYHKAAACKRDKVTVDNIKMVFNEIGAGVEYGPNGPRISSSSALALLKLRVLLSVSCGISIFLYTYTLLYNAEFYPSRYL
jgi:hypothetical protein